MAYFPNATAGDQLDQQCETCPAGQKDSDMGCPIRMVQSRWNYDQLDKGQEKLKEAMTVLIDEDGYCRMRPLIVLPEKPKTEPPEWLAVNPLFPERYGDL